MRKDVSGTVSNKRIAKNTLMLYMRMLLVMVVQLYTVPIVLRSLGVSDYGLYHVVGGAVTMFSFVSSSLISGTQRYLSFAIGRGDLQLLKRTFETTNIIFSFCALAMLVVVEVIGLWLLHFKMNVPEGRMFAADCVFQLSCFSFVLSILTIPYNSTIIAHEKMNIYAYVSIMECSLKLALAVSLPYINQDKLIYYAAIIFLLTTGQRVFYQIYCKRKFEECRDVKLTWNAEIGRNLLGYSGWNMVGTLSKMGSNHGLNVLLNIFYGTVINAAHGIAMQVNGLIEKFGSNIRMATRPAITKLYARGEVEEMWKLVFRSSKWISILFTLICVPILLEKEEILKIWLHDYPQYTTDIVEILVFVVFVESTCQQIASALQAANKVKKMQRNGGLMLLSVLPISYVGMKFFAVSILFPYYIIVLMRFCQTSYIIYLAHREIGLNIKKYLTEVVFKNIFVLFGTILVVYLTKMQMEESIMRLVIIILVSTMTTIGISFCFGMDKNERSYVIKYIRRRIGKVKKRIL